MTTGVAAGTTAAVTPVRTTYNQRRRKPMVHDDVIPAASGVNSFGGVFFEEATEDQAALELLLEAQIAADAGNAARMSELRRQAVELIGEDEVTVLIMEYNLCFLPDQCGGAVSCRHHWFGSVRS
jgi:hypothetical protein